MAYAAFSSHPSRVRGLKRLAILIRDFVTGSHPSRVRGLKQRRRNPAQILLRVAPFTGAWIETIGELDVGRRLCGRTLHGCVD